MAVPPDRPWDSHLTLQTQRLTLRPLHANDFAALATLLGDAEALAFWGAPLDDAGVGSWIERNVARYERDGFGRCAVVLRATDELIGDAGLIRTTVEGADEVELGWIVRRSHWGRGVAPEAARAWLAYAFDALGLPRVVSMVSEENVASRRVAEKLGMSVERTAVWGEGPMLMYSTSRPSQRPAHR